MYLEIFQLSLLLISCLISLCSESRYCLISILLDLLKCVLWHRMYLSCWMSHVNVSKMCFLLFLDEVVYRCYSNQLIDGVVQFNDVLTDFLPTISFYFLGIFKYPALIVHSSFPSLLYHFFWLHVIWSFFVGHIHIKNYVLKINSSLCNALL